eukprot:XP_765954.1 hypothetical protein [Theileria parva strain Muguga]
MDRVRVLVLSWILESVSTSPTSFRFRANFGAIVDRILAPWVRHQSLERDVLDALVLLHKLKVP